MGIINPIEVNPVTLQALIDAVYAVLAENSRHLKHTSKLEKLEFLLDDVETYYLKELNHE